MDSRPVPQSDMQCGASAPWSFRILLPPELKAVPLCRTRPPSVCHLRYHKLPLCCNPFKIIDKCSLHLTTKKGAPQTFVHDACLIFLFRLFSVCNSLDLNQCTLRKCCNLKSCSCRASTLKEGSVNLVHGAKISNVI